LTKSTVIHLHSEYPSSLLTKQRQIPLRPSGDTSLTRGLLQHDHILEIGTDKEDINYYGAYVGNYGSTLLNIYRESPDFRYASATFMSLFKMGKNHYNSVGKAASQEIGGGIDWPA
jgi:hypothetical protein